VGVGVTTPSLRVTLAFRPTSTPIAGAAAGLVEHYGGFEEDLLAA
jgi:hypothetical protein